MLSLVVHSGVSVAALGLGSECTHDHKRYLLNTQKHTFYFFLCYVVQFLCFVLLSCSRN